MTTSRSELPDLTRYPYWAFDTETTGLDYPVDSAFGLSLATPDKRSWYIDLRVTPCRDWWEDQVSGSKIIVGFNEQFDILMMLSAGYEMPFWPTISDTMIRACLIDEHLSTVFPWPRRRIEYSLDSLCSHYLGKNKSEAIWPLMAERFGGAPTRKAQIHRLHMAPPEWVAEYAKPDAELALELWEWQEVEIERQGIREIVDFEARVAPSIIRAAARGVPVAPDRANEAMGKLTTEIVIQQAELNRVCGKEVNVNSSPQVRALFAPRQMSDGTWVADNGTICSTTDKGLASIDAEVLGAMEGDPRAELIGEVRSLIKTRDTFLKKYIRDGSFDGRVYPTINQTAGEAGGTKTGRFSYVEPALQQIPSRNKIVAAIVKSCFPAPDGMKWVDGDMASFEVRVFAHLVALYNSAVADAYKLNPHMDFHQWVADLMHVPRNPVAEGGANAKQLNLSMIFNSGRGAIAAKLGLPWEWDEYQRGDELIRYRKPGEEAAAVIEHYHEKIQGVRVLADRCKKTAEIRGWIETEFGRRLRFPKGYKSYKASGLLIQATSADVNKENWVLVEEALGNDGHLILNTHDSYSMAIDEDAVTPAWGRVKEAVERPVLRVPLILELSGVGDTWWNAVSGG